MTDSSCENRDVRSRPNPLAFFGGVLAVVIGLFSFSDFVDGLGDLGSGVANNPVGSLAIAIGLAVTLFSSAGWWMPRLGLVTKKQFTHQVQEWVKGEGGYHFTVIDHAPETFRIRVEGKHGPFEMNRLGDEWVVSRALARPDLVDPYAITKLDSHMAQQAMADAAAGHPLMHAHFRDPWQWNGVIYEIRLKVTEVGDRELRDAIQALHTACDRARVAWERLAVLSGIHAQLTTLGEAIERGEWPNNLS